MAPDPDVLLKLLIAAAFIINLAIGVVTLSATRRVQRREITLSTSFTPQTSFDHEITRLQAQIQTLNQDIAHIRAEMKFDRNEILAAGETRAVKIHERINILSVSVMDAIGQLRGELKRMP